MGLTSHSPVLLPSIVHTTGDGSPGWPLHRKRGAGNRVGLAFQTCSKPAANGLSAIPDFTEVGLK